MPLFTIVATSVSEGSDEAELDVVADEFSVEAEAVGYARRIADETHRMAAQLKLDFDYSHVCVFEGDLGEEETLDPSHPALVGMWWYGEDGTDWADADAVRAAPEGEEPADGAEPAPAATH